MNDKVTVAYLEGVVDRNDVVPYLIGGRHKEAGKIVFPNPGGDFYEPVRLGREGTIWSFTIQRFPPKSPPYKGLNSPENFEPYCVAYVELPGEVIVQTRIHGVPLDEIQIGQEVELVILPFVSNCEDGPDTIYCFQPLHAEAES